MTARVVSFQLRDALRRPPIHHPLFTRAAARRYRPPAPPRPWSRRKRLLVALAAGLALYLGIAYFLQLVVMVVFFIPLVAVLVYITLHGTIAGLFWATEISSAIAREHRRGSYELVSTSPYGAFSASWAICTGQQYYDQVFHGSGAQRVWFARFFFLTLLLVSAIISLADPHGSMTSSDFFLVVELLVMLALAFYADDVQSTVIGSLVGMVVPFFARSRLDARVGAFVVFLVIQTFAYALVWWLAFAAVPQFSAGLPFDAPAALPVVQLLIFFGVREAVIRGLWITTTYLFAGDVSDLQMLSKGGRLLY